MFDSTALTKIIAAYKQDFKRVHIEEIYKWKAVKWFQSNWRIGDDDFASMLENALASKMTDNLLGSKSQFPRSMICSLANADPEAVRTMFIGLFNEDASLEGRADLT